MRYYCFSCFFTIFMLTSSIFGQEGVDRDDSRNAIAGVEGLNFGSVDPRSGVLKFNIPIGQAYPQRNGGQYQLRFEYNSHIFTYKNRPTSREEHEPGFPHEPPLNFDRLAYLNWDEQLAYAGLAFIVNTGFGALELHVGGSGTGITKKATMTLPDGKEIFFYDKFKEGNGDTVNTWFSRGGEYARLRYYPGDDHFEVELPTGLIHVFEKIDGDYLATQIKDRFNAANTISMAYEETTTIDNEIVPQWKITDSIGREFFITFGKKFKPYGDAELEGNPDIHPFFIETPEYYIVTSIQVPTVGGTSVTYNLTQEDLLDFKPFHEAHTLNPIFFDEYQVPLLNAIAMPEDESFQFKYYQTEVTGGHVGAIRRLTNNYGGQISWEYTKIFDPDNSGSPLSTDPFMAISKQAQFDSDGSTLLANSEFKYLLIDEHGIFEDPDGDSVGGERSPSTRRDRVTIVRTYETETTFNDKAYYFNMRNYPTRISYEDHREFSNPITPIIQKESRFFQMPGTLHLVKRVFFPGDPSRNAAVFLTSRTFEGSYDAGTALISEYTAYDSDEPLTHDDIVRSGHDQLINSRPWVNVTKYHLAGNARITFYEDWTGFGSFRSETISTDFVVEGSSGFDLNNPNLRTTYTHFLPGPEADAGGLVWLLNLSTYREIKEANSPDILKIETAHNPDNGFLERTRFYKSLDGNPGEHDVIHVYVADEFGRKSEVHTFGGDIKKLDPREIGAGNLASLNLNDIKPETRTKMTFESGTVKTEEALYKNTGHLFLKLIDRNIDANTGHVVKETTPDGVYVTFAYDEMGRRIQEAPQDGAVTNTIYTPYDAEENRPARIEYQTKKRGSSGTIYSITKKFLDGWGRAFKQRSKYQDENWSLKHWNYSQKPDGRLNSESTTYDESTGTPTWVQYTYDALGRKKTVTLPDNTVTTFSYLGSQEVTKTKQIGTGLELTDETRRTIYDALGRIIEVSQKDRGDGNESIAEYEYNTLGKLDHVSLKAIDPQSPQDRAWNFDGLGNLLSEYHPELGAPIFYRNHDSGGRVGILEQKEDGEIVRQLKYIYLDPMRRLTQVWDGVADRLLTENFYSQENSGGNKSAGKLFQTRRHNYVAAGRILDPTTNHRDILVTKTFFYEESNGTMSRTRTRATSGTDIDALTFEMGITKNDLGGIEELSYPQIPNDLIPNPNPQGGANQNPEVKLTHKYFDGDGSQLRKIELMGGANPVSAINYHPNGMLWNITFPNGVIKTTALASNNLSRPKSITTTGVKDPVTGNSDNFDSGLFAYDGSGNILSIGDDSYYYDAVGRLTEAMITDLQGVGSSHTYTYDRFGNLINKNGFDISVNHENKNRLSEEGFSYDIQGNLITTDAMTYTYDPLNMTKTAEDATGIRTYVYATNEEGKDYRFLSINPGGEVTWALRGSSGKLLRTYEGPKVRTIRAKKDHVFAGSLAAIYEYLPSGPIKRHYIVTDHLGSIRMRTDGAGRVVRKYKYDPFGNDLPGSSTQNDDILRFTEHERDNDQQTYMLARYYHPKFARFNSIDPIQGSPADPQSWNRYAYVKNNPVKWKDPDGRQLSPFTVDLIGTAFSFAIANGAMKGVVSSARIYNSAVQEGREANASFKKDLRKVGPRKPVENKGFLRKIFNGKYAVSPEEAARNKRTRNDLRKIATSKLKKAAGRKLAAQILLGVSGAGFIYGAGDTAIDVMNINSELQMANAVNDIPENAKPYDQIVTEDTQSATEETIKLNLGNALKDALENNQKKE